MNMLRWILKYLEVFLSYHLSFVDLLISQLSFISKLITAIICNQQAEYVRHVIY